MRERLQVGTDTRRTRRILDPFLALVSIMTIYKLLGTEARPQLLGTNSCAPDSIYAIRTEMGWTDSFDIAGFINMLTSIQKKSYPQNDALHI